MYAWPLQSNQTRETKYLWQMKHQLEKKSLCKFRQTETKRQALKWLKTEIRAHSPHGNYVCLNKSQTTELNDPGFTIKLCLVVTVQ